MSNTDRLFSGRIEPTKPGEGEFTPRVAGAEHVEDVMRRSWFFTELKALVDRRLKRKRPEILVPIPPKHH